MFRNRTEAGKQLAKKLSAYANRDDLLVLALPRGGVPVADEVAKELRAPLDVFIVRKLGVPGQEELAMGAIATGGVCVLNNEVVYMLRVPRHTIQMVIAREQQELERREKIYRDDRPPPEINKHVVILIDDGLATGSTMRAAIKAIRQQGPSQIIVAVPVAAPSVCEELAREVGKIVCVETHEPLYGVGYWYEDFTQITDEEVHNLLTQSEQERPVPVRKR